MGFLIKKIFFLLILIAAFAGCGKSLIEITVNDDENPYPMFGKSSNRNFYVPLMVSDSIKLKWESEVYGNFSNSSITAYDEYIFTSDLGGRIYVFDINDGKRVGVLKSSDAIFTAPLLTKSLVIYAVAEEKNDLTDLVYYNFSAGERVYYEEIDGRTISQLAGTDDGIIFLTEDGKLYKYNYSGSSVWETITGVTSRCSPSLENGIIIFGNDNGEVITVSESDGKIINRKTIEGMFTASPVIDDGIVYMSNNNGKIFAININNLDIVWKFDTDARILMSPAIDDENVIVGNLKGILFSINKSSGKLNWEQNFGGLFNATPLLTLNRIIIPDINRSIHFIDKRTGELKKTYILEGRAKLTPVIFKNTLFIGYDKGLLRAYEFVY